MNASDRNTALFSAICREESGFVVGVLKRHGVRSRDLPDVAQDVLLAVWCRFADYDETRPIRPWLYGFAVRFAFDYCRLARHDREDLTAQTPDTAHHEPSAENIIITQQDKRIALEAIDRLPPHFRSVLMMHADGMSTPQIAATLGIAKDTGYTRLRRPAQFDEFLRKCEAHGTFRLDAEIRRHPSWSERIN